MIWVYQEFASQGITSLKNTLGFLKVWERCGNNEKPPGES